MFYRNELDLSVRLANQAGSGHEVAAQFLQCTAQGIRGLSRTNLSKQKIRSIVKIELGLALSDLGDDLVIQLDTDDSVTREQGITVQRGSSPPLVAVPLASPSMLRASESLSFVIL